MEGPRSIHGHAHGHSEPEPTDGFAAPSVTPTPYPNEEPAEAAERSAQDPEAGDETDRDGDFDPDAGPDANDPNDESSRDRDDDGHRDDETVDAPIEIASDHDGEPAHRGRQPRERRERKGEHRSAVKQLMLVNDVPGDECRIAVLENGRLEALFMEREGTATNVGNIYKGRVTNVEPAIQAAFIDYGEGASGFLHISDLHPKYFPGEERTERVGRKIPRRERPLMQEALRKGQEVIVQVLKEGLGSKGPTLTSYLSIPGRLMVMMPDMDRVGVSRKVEDEDQRRAMRKILDQLDLPEGFGFILRTAGFDRTKTELGRDLAYLKRLWEVMQRRTNTTGAPCMLYSEGDLLIRSIRDMADEQVEAIVVDSEDAFRKATAFLDVVAPRNAPKVRFWEKSRANGDGTTDGRVPLFHAFDVERQITMLHSREVPLPSGGALVIDQAEALVAIDVNSGRSRSARDSETNAYYTNIEAVDEIARQLRLRDLGGVIINDLIDMRAPKHRRDIEDRFRDALKRDRAKSTVLPISDFGVVEMTRQRMRPSVRKTHFMDCPHCHGLGEVMMPETVAADHLRGVEFLCSFAKVQRVEIVCSTRVATVLLSSKRRALYELELRTGRRIDVRISEAIPIDRVDIYAYDERGADVEIARLPRPSRPHLDAIPSELPEHLEVAEVEDIDAEPETGGRRGRRRRRRKPGPADTTAMILSGSFDDLPDAAPDDDEMTIAEAIAAERASALRQQQAQAAAAASGAPVPAARTPGPGRASEGEEGEEGGRRRRRRRRRGGRDRDASVSEVAAVTAPAVPELPPEPPPPPSEPTLVHLLAKELEIGSKELLARCREGGLEVKSHMTKLTGEQVDLVKNWYRPAPPPPPPPLASVLVAIRDDDEGVGDDGDRTDATAPGAGGNAPGATGDREGGGRRKRRRRGRRRGGADGASPAADGTRPPAAPRSPEQRDRPQSKPHGASQAKPHPAPHAKPNAGPNPVPSAAPNAGPRRDEGGEGEGGKRKRRRRRRGRGGDGEARAPQTDAGPPERGTGGNGPTDAASRSNGERPAAKQPPPQTPPTGRGSGSPASPAIPPPSGPPRRSLYGGRYRKLSGPTPGGGDDE